MYGMLPECDSDRSLCYLCINMHGSCFLKNCFFLQVSSQSAGWGDGALSRPEAGNRSAEEEAGRTGREALSEGPGAGQVTRDDCGPYVNT